MPLRAATAPTLLPLLNCDPPQRKLSDRSRRRDVRSGASRRPTIRRGPEVPLKSTIAARNSIAAAGSTQCRVMPKPPHQSASQSRADACGSRRGWRRLRRATSLRTGYGARASTCSGVMSSPPRRWVVTIGGPERLDPLGQGNPSGPCIGAGVEGGGRADRAPKFVWVQQRSCGCAGPCC